MSTQDRSRERTLADFYDSVRPVPEDKGPRGPRIKRFAEAFTAGLALASVWHLLTD